LPWRAGAGRGFGGRPRGVGGGARTSAAISVATGSPVACAMRRAMLRLIGWAPVQRLECPQIYSTDLDDLRLLAGFGEVVPPAVPGV
jgi:hypothetical protein